MGEHDARVPGPSAPAEGHLAAILDFLEEAVITQSLDGTITGWNPAAERMFGYSAAEAIGRPISLIIPPEKGAEEVGVLARIGRGERSEHLETTRVRRDGRRIEVLLTSLPLKDESGRVVGAVKIARDITERNRMEEQLRLERERLQVTLASIGDGVIVTDVRGFVEFVNPVAEALTGWKQAEAKGKPLEAVFNIICEKTRHRAENPAVRALREGLIIGLANHTILIARDGTELAIDDSAAPIRDAAGQVSGVILVFRDVTGARAVNDVRAQLASIVENSEDAIIGKDLQGIIRTWNRGAESIFGYTAQEAIGRSITMLIPVEHLAAEAEILGRLRRGERVDHFETIRLAKDRRRVEVSLTISPICDAEGEVVGASKIARDITEKKRGECELKQAHAQLKQHAAELEEQVAARTAELKGNLEELEVFSSGLSHDLKAPLRAIAGYAQALQEDHSERLPPEARELVRKVVQGCGRMGRLVENVVAYSRLRGEAVAMETVGVERVVERVLEEFPHAKDANAEVVVERPLLDVQANEPLLLQTMANLVSNGVKFVAPGTRPRLRLWTSREGDRVRVWIEDNGIGVPESEREKIFAIFTRLQSNYEGTGVGLAVVHRAVLRMGGQVGVEPAPERGSRFWVELAAGG